MPNTEDRFELTVEDVRERNERLVIFSRKLAFKLFGKKWREHWGRCVIECIILGEKYQPKGLPLGAFIYGHCSSFANDVDIDRKRLWQRRKDVKSGRGKTLGEQVQGTVQMADGTERALWEIAPSNEPSPDETAEHNDNADFARQVVEESLKELNERDSGLIVAVGLKEETLKVQAENRGVTYAANACHHRTALRRFANSVRQKHPNIEFELAGGRL